MNSKLEPKETLLHLHTDAFDKDVEPIPNFRGKYQFLSNFWFHHHITDLDFPTISYPTVEHAYQANKVAPDNRDAQMIREHFSMLHWPKQAKREGRKLGDNFRIDWEAVKVSTMYYHLSLKFSKNTSKGEVLVQQLINTYPAKLVKGNAHHDNEWGNCRCHHCKDIDGKNYLGTLLMKLRHRLILAETGI